MAELITITETGKQPIVLGDNAKKWAISQDLPSQFRIGQRQPLFRARYQKVFNRKNRLNAFGFFVDRRHDTPEAALTHKWTHADLVPEQGVLIVKDGGFARVMRDAFIEEVECVFHAGVTTVFRYSIIGGLWTIT